MPTLTLETRWGDKLERMAFNLTDGTKQQDNYFEVKVQDKIATYGGCSAWRSYTRGELSYSNLFKTPSKMSLLASSNYNSDEVSRVTCSDISVTSQILSKIIAPPASGTTATLTCQGHSWKVKDCANDGYASLCVDCDDPCARDFCTPTAPFYVGPCNTAGVSCSFPSAYFRIFSVDFLDSRGAPPSFASSATNSSRTTASIRLTTSGAGTVSCGIFPSGQQPASIAEITVQKLSASTLQNSVNFTATGLVPSSSYDWFCCTASSSGAAMSLSDVLSSKVTVQTRCCLLVTVSVGVVSVYQSAQSLDAVTLTADALVPAGLTVQVRAVAEAGNVVSEMAVVTLRNSLRATVSILAVNTAVSGKVTVQAAVVNNTMYGIAFRGGINSFVVLTRAQAPPSPAVLSAIFSPAGNNILVSFDSPTNRAAWLVSASFACNTMFTVSDVGAGTCQWSSNTVLVYTPPANSVVVPGSTMLFLGNRLKALCTLTPASSCNGWPFSDAKILTVQTSAGAVVPTVQLSTPAVLNECNSLSMDFSSSTGAGNRAWSRVAFSVSGYNASSALRIQTHLNQLASFRPPIVVPSRLFSSGYYNIQLTLCNFLGRCGLTSNFIAMSSAVIPTVSISGSLLRTVSRSQALQIDADAFAQSCTSNVSRVGLVNSWSVFSNDFVVNNLVSTSKLSTSFRLNAFELSVNSVYTIRFASQSSVSGKTASVSVQVYVQPGSLVAFIKQGASFGLQLGQNVTLDASQSYDQDVSPLLRSAAGLSYYWSCIRVLPTINTSCDFALDASARFSSKLPILAGYSTASSSYAFTVSVSDNTRSSSATTTVQVLSQSNPITSVQTALVGKLNAADKLKLSATVMTRSTASSIWSVNDSSVSLTGGLLTPLSRTFTVPINSTATLSTFVFNFALQANSLPANAYLTFTLTTTVVGGGTVSSSVVVVTNGAPLPGIFVVLPTQGIALTDTFQFSASLWQDDDLPLSYSFGFLSKTISATFQPLRDRAEATYGSFLLPVGSDANSFALVCAVYVFDAIGVNATANTVVSVRAAPSTSLQSYLTANTPDFSNPSSVQRLLSVVSEQLNSVSCANSPLCRSLNRLECARVPNTCGACFTNFVGDYGDANTLCFNASAAVTSQQQRSSLRSTDTTWLAHRGGRSLAAASCFSDSSCPLFQSCNMSTLRCYTPSKQCASDCFQSLGRGDCQYLATPASSGRRVQSCLLSDYDCVAQCSCTVGWAGPTCAMDAATALVAQQTRSVLLMNLNNLTQAQDLNAESLSTYISTLSSITFHPEEVSVPALHSLHAVLDFILDSASTITVPTVLLGSLLDIFNSVLPTASTNATLQRAYPLLSHADILQVSQGLVGTQTTLLQGLIAVIQADAVVGENIFSYVQSGDVRIKLLSANSYDFGSSFSTHVAETPLEMNGLASLSSMRLGDIPANQDVLLSVLQLQYSDMLLRYLKLNSHPILLSVQDASSVCHLEDGACEFTFDMVHTVKKEFVLSNPNTRRFVTHCRHDRVFNATTYPCEGGLHVTAVCPGNFTGYITSECPYVAVAPSCGVIFGELFSAQTCRTLTFTNDSTQCACNISSDALTVNFGRRRMAAAGSGVEVSSQSIRTLVPAVHTETVIVPPVSPGPFNILGLEALELWLIFGAIVLVLLALAAYFFYRRWGAIMDTDSQYDAVDYVTYAKLLRTNILELLAANLAGREALLFLPLQMTDTVALRIEGDKSAKKATVDEVEDLLYIQEKLRQENEKLPYWKLSLNSEIELGSDNYTEQKAESATEEKIEKLMNKFRAELIDADGPLDLPVRVELSEKDDPMLQNDAPRGLSAKFASLGFRSPSLFNFDPKRLEQEPGSNPHFTDIYSSKNGDESFSFAYNKKDIAHARQSRYVRSGNGSPTPFQETDSVRGTYAIDFSAEMNTSETNAAELYEDVSFKSFHMGNSARDDSPLSSNGVFYTNDEAAETFHFSNQMVKTRSMSLTEHSIKSGEWSSPTERRLASASDGRAQDFFAPISEYGHFGEGNEDNDSAGEEAGQPAPPFGMSMLMTLSSHGPMGSPIGSPVGSPGTLSSRSARNERWSSMLERARMRSTHHLDIPLSPATDLIAPPTSGTSPDAANEVPHQFDETTDLEGGMMSPKNSPSAGSLAKHMLPRPYAVRTKSSSNVGSPSSHQNSPSILRKGASSAGAETVGRFSRANSFVSVASSSRDTITTAASVRRGRRMSRNFDADDGTFLSTAESAADMFESEPLVDFLAALKQEIVVDGSDASDTIDDENLTIYEYDLAESNVQESHPHLLAPQVSKLVAGMPRKRASSPTNTNVSRSSDVRSTKSTKQAHANLGIAHPSAKTPASTVLLSVPSVSATRMRSGSGGSNGSTNGSTVRPRPVASSPAVTRPGNATASRSTRSMPTQDSPSAKLHSSSLVLTPQVTALAASMSIRSSPNERSSRSAFTASPQRSSRSASPVPVPVPAHVAVPEAPAVRNSLRLEMGAYEDPHQNFTAKLSPALHKTEPLRSPTAADAVSSTLLAQPRPSANLLNKPAQRSSKSPPPTAKVNRDVSAPNTSTEQDDAASTISREPAPALEDPSNPARSWYVRNNNVSLLTQRYEAPKASNPLIRRQSSFRTGGPPPARPLFQLGQQPAPPTPPIVAPVVRPSNLREPRATSAATMHHNHEQRSRSGSPSKSGANT